MSTSRGSGARNGNGVQPIPAGSRNVVQSLKEIVNCPEAEIYATLKECNMDPNEAVNRLLAQDSFHEVKNKREKKKEGKNLSESRYRGANSSSNQGSKAGADRQYGRSFSAQFYSSDSSLHGKTTSKKENESGPYSSSLSSVRGGSENSRIRELLGSSDNASAESKGLLLETSDGLPPVSQLASGYQPAWVGTSGQVSMADIVRMGRPNTKGSNAPNASHHNIQDPFINESLHMDHAPKVNQWEAPSFQHVPTCDEWPSTENPAILNVLPVPEHPVETEWHPEESSVSNEIINYHYEAEDAGEGQVDNFISSGHDVGSVTISSGMIPEDVSRVASQFENGLFTNLGTYESEVHDSEHHEVNDVGASVTSVTTNFQQLLTNKDDRGFPSEANPLSVSVVIPKHLKVETAECSHLTFGSFGSTTGAACSSGTKASVLEESEVEEAQNETEESTEGQLETRHSEYYVDDSLRNTTDDSLLHQNSPTLGSYNASSAPQPEELRPESDDGADGNQYPLPSSSSSYTFDDAQRLNAAFDPTSSQIQSPAPFSNVMQPYSNSLPSALLATNIHPTRESDPQYSPFSLTQTLAAKYGNSVSSIRASEASVSEALKSAGLQFGQPPPQPLSGNSIATGPPPLPQHLAAVHQYSQPTLPLGPYANMIGYPFLPQNYTYMPSAFHQSLAGHQSLAAMLPQYKSSVSASSLPPQSVDVASGYSGFGNSSTIPGNYSVNPASVAPSGTSLSYDGVSGSQYKDSSHLLSLQQNENLAMWLHGNSRTMSPVPASTLYNYQAQNQQPGGFRQVQQQSQNYGSTGNQNFYHQSQPGISLNHHHQHHHHQQQQQQQNPRDASLGGPQGQTKQSQIWPNNY